MDAPKATSTPLIGSPWPPQGRRRTGSKRRDGYPRTVTTAPTYERLEVAGLTVVRWPALDSTGVVDAVVTTRHGGISEGPFATLNLGLHVGDDPDAVVENRTRAAAAVGLDLDDLIFCRQSHGANVAVVTADDRGRGARSDDTAIAATDALITIDADVGLVVMVADCVPLVIVDPTARVLACVHAGWRGTTARIAEVAVHQMVTLGADPQRMVVGVGPAIPAHRYQVGDDVVDATRAAFGRAADQFVTADGTGRWLFDVWAANLHTLLEAGVQADNIHLAAIDSGSPDFFSDRAERPCGRFAAIARLRP